MNRPPFLNFFENSSDLVALLVPYLYLGSLSVCHILYWGKLKVLFAIELRSKGCFVYSFCMFVLLQQCCEVKAWKYILNIVLSENRLIQSWSDKKLFP